MQTEAFLKALCSKSPTPGGGGASALVAAVGTALTAMVANLTSGKKKYAEHQDMIEMTILRAEEACDTLLTFIERDAEAFAPLAAAYSIPKDTPEREETLEKALKTACLVPYELLSAIVDVIPLTEAMAQYGSRLAVSDAAVSACTLRAAAEGAAMNVYVNTKLMRDRAFAEEQNEKTNALLQEAMKRCGAVYDGVRTELGGNV